MVRIDMGPVAAAPYLNPGGSPLPTTPCSNEPLEAEVDAEGVVVLTGVSVTLSTVALRGNPIRTSLSQVGQTTEFGPSPIHVN
jgi:hypothetical protein